MKPGAVQVEEDMPPTAQGMLTSYCWHAGTLSGLSGRIKRPLQKGSWRSPSAMNVTDDTAMEGRRSQPHVDRRTGKDTDTTPPSLA